MLQLNRYLMAVVVVLLPAWTYLMGLPVWITAVFLGVLSGCGAAYLSWYVFFPSPKTTDELVREMDDQAVIQTIVRLMMVKEYSSWEAKGEFMKFPGTTFTFKWKVEGLDNDNLPDAPNHGRSLK
jgi:hypothetical protein